MICASVQSKGHHTLGNIVAGYNVFSCMIAMFPCFRELQRADRSVTWSRGGVKVLFLLMPILVVTEAKRRRSE